MKKFLLLSVMFCGTYLHCSEEFVNDNYSETSDEEIQRVEDNGLRDNQKEEYVKKLEKEIEEKNSKIKELEEEKNSYVEQIKTKDVKILGLELVKDFNDSIIDEKEELEKEIEKKDLMIEDIEWTKKWYIEQCILKDRQIQGLELLNNFKDIIIKRNENFEEEIKFLIEQNNNLKNRNEELEKYERVNKIVDKYATIICGASFLTIVALLNRMGMISNYFTCSLIACMFSGSVLAYYIPADVTLDFSDKLFSHLNSYTNSIISYLKKFTAR